MIIDTHFHTKEYSICSSIDMEAGIVEAKKLGLGGICITDHDTVASKELAKNLQDKYSILVIPGTEVQTVEGDILCFGIDDIPEGTITAQKLVEHVEKSGGACIAAHPFRDNDRGLKENICNIKGIHAIEALNGNTDDESNIKAEKLANELGIPCTGGSDAHNLKNIGKYATRFPKDVQDETGFIEALRAGNINPISFHDDTAPCHAAK
ncbi:hypothetical protein SAMN02745751_00218 [Dethiosulfatibacter aminovorans DSM 17477]|uniref:Polymerase/histidinol phosphatase N-terminal domain-containing protein n=1 Tax=Dethiosulfatibacter aminovorans DSM 17477 TaxID=1121476 RepID=A0A1M6AR38_9FIRM|nr:PHP domain-containing protein [Dethiosulfatibacter aminovorans]SHI38960.1 hypothetical protein SAMN02745751_00218 [Dethiosulfatibacter aminovorans DSM 17477]